MALPSFDIGFNRGERVKPRICVLEIRDRETLDGEPIAWLLVERQEAYRMNERDGSIYEASIRLFYERILPKHSHLMGGKGSFFGGYTRGYTDEPSVSLTSDSTAKGAVFLDLPGLEGQRIGTYLMNEIVTWAQQWPDATVRPVELLVGQAHAENKARRNRFYEQFGLAFDYRDPEQCEGLSKPLQAKALIPIEAWKENIRERDVREYLGELLYARERMAAENARQERAIKSLSHDIKRAEARPIRWALRQVWWKVAGPLGLLMLGALVWAAFKSR